MIKSLRKENKSAANLAIAAFSAVAVLSAVQCQPALAAQQQGGVREAATVCAASLQVSAAAAKGSIDAIQASGATAAAKVSGKNEVSSDETLSFSGWAAGADMNAPANLCLVSDGHPVPSAIVVHALNRADVSKYFKNPALRASGFLVTIPASALGTGQHVVSVGVVDGSELHVLQNTSITVH